MHPYRIGTNVFVLHHNENHLPEWIPGVVTAFAPRVNGLPPGNYVQAGGCHLLVMDAEELRPAAEPPIEKRRALRKLMIKLAKKRQRPGSGSSQEFLGQRTNVMKWPDMSSVLHPIQWAVIGAVATRLYMPERMTADFDILIAASDASAARRKLQAAGYTFISELSIGGSSWISPDGTQVDMLEEVDKVWSRAIAEAQTNRDPDGFPVIPLPYLILMKLRAGRAQDSGDISRMLAQASEKEIESAKKLVKRQMPDDLEDLESLIELSRLERP